MIVNGHSATEARLVAEVDALLDLVQELVRMAREAGGYVSHEHRMVLRVARSVLTEHGRIV